MAALAGLHRVRLIAIIAALCALLVTGAHASPAVAVPAATATIGDVKANIKHVVVLMQENRSFDTYFGQLHNYQVRLHGSSDVEPEPASASNPDPTGHGGPIVNFHKTTYCEVADLNHSWNGTHQEYDGGLMDGFTAANVNTADPTGSRAMGWYNEQDLPYYYDLYDHFAIGDRFFASTLTQTFPNRFYLLAGTSFGHIANDFPSPSDPTAFNQTTVFDRLDAHHVSWRIYYSEIAFGLLFSHVRNHAAKHVFPISQYFIDAKAGLLPQVSYIDPIFLAPAAVETDEHPASNVQVGQKFVQEVIKHTFNSPSWKDSALFLTYDEHGGFYDHVPPPAAPVPDAIPPMLKGGDTNAAFDHYGIRVPVAVVSRFARPHYVSHAVHDHTSILRFIEERFGLGSLTNRDAAADPMFEFFDFSGGGAFAHPPALAAATIDPAQEAACATAPPNLAL